MPPSPASPGGGRPRREGFGALEPAGDGLGEIPGRLQPGPHSYIPPEPPRTAPPGDPAGAGRPGTFQGGALGGMPGLAGSSASSPATAAMARQEAITELGTPQTPPKPDTDIHCLTIIGQVEGHLHLPAQNKTTKYEHVLPQLVAVNQNEKIKGLLVILNTVGGDVEAGLAIAELVRNLNKPTVSLVLGGGHSIGLPIATAADRSFIAPTATVTIHPIRMNGLVIGVPQTYEYLDKMQDRVIRFVTGTTRIDEARLRELMFRTGELARDVGTVLVGAEAVHEGLIHEVGGLGQATAALRHLIGETEGGGAS